MAVKVFQSKYGHWNVRVGKMVAVGFTSKMLAERWAMYVMLPIVLKNLVFETCMR